VHRGCPPRSRPAGDVELADIIGGPSQSLHVHDRFDERVDVGRRLCTPSSTFMPLSSPVRRASPSEKGGTERHVAEDHDEDAAQSNVTTGPTTSFETPMSVDAAGHHLADHDAVDARLLVGLLGLR
jgi:hypothetical protein